MASNPERHARVAARTEWALLACVLSLGAASCSSGESDGCQVDADCELGATYPCMKGVCGGVDVKFCLAVPVENGTACPVADLCQIGACQAGACIDPVPKTCPTGTPGNSCTVQHCDPANGECVTPGEGDACDDFDPCTSGDVCTAGSCVGVSNGGCGTFFSADFEACPGGWTLTGDWQCGVPLNVGPAAAHGGSQCLATQIEGNYSDLQAWAAATATSPDIDLTGAVAPQLTFWIWIDTEGSTYDGANLKISTDGGLSYAVVPDPTPAYALTIAGEPAWGGHQAGLGWQPVTVDLLPYVGNVVSLRFAFRSDASGTFPGVYVDDLLVATP